MSGLETSSTGSAATAAWTMRRVVSLVLRLAITLTIIGYLGTRVQWREFAIRLQQSDVTLLGLACLLLGAACLLGGLRWWLLLRVQDIALPLKAVVAITFIGQFFNAYLLGSVGGDAVKAVYLWRLAPHQKTHATLSIIMDRTLGLFVLLCFALATLPWHLPALAANDSTRSVVYGLAGTFAAMVLAGAALLLVPFSHVPAPLRKLWLKVPLRRILEMLIGGFRQHKRAPRLTAGAFFCSVLIYLIVFFAGLHLGHAIGLRMTYLQVVMILSVVICVISLPISIGGHGVREGAFVLLFAAFGVITVDPHTGAGYEVAVLYSLLFFALLLVWGLVGGVVYIFFRADPGLSAQAAKPPSTQ